MNFPLDAEQLLDTARVETSLDDFGDPTFEEGLRVLLDALRDEGDLSPMGIEIHRFTLGRLLRERLRVLDWHRRHPEISQQAVRAPFFITGLPRTGTTALSHLLAEDPDTRSLAVWESEEPTPPPETATRDNDPRIAACAQRLGYLLANPEFLKMYDGTATSPTENIDLLGQHFRTEHFEGMAAIPGYIRWWLGCDMLPAYRHHKLTLQLLQWRCPPTRWNLKSPPDLCHLPAFAKIYPDARILWTHRDPATVLASVCKLIAFIRAMQCEHIDPLQLGREQLALWSEGTRRALEFRSSVGKTNFVDVFLADMVKRPLETVAKIYDRFDLPFTAEAERRMRAWSHSHGLHRHGSVSYTLAEFGLDRDKIREAFRSYTDHFSIPLED